MPLLCFCVCSKQIPQKRSDLFFFFFGKSHPSGEFRYSQTVIICCTFGYFMATRAYNFRKHPQADLMNEVVLSLKRRKILTLIAPSLLQLRLWLWHTSIHLLILLSIVRVRSAMISVLKLFFKQIMLVTCNSKLCSADGLRVLRNCPMAAALLLPTVSKWLLTSSTLGAINAANALFFCELVVPCRTLR